MPEDASSLARPPHADPSVAFRDPVTAALLVAAVLALPLAGVRAGLLPLFAAVAVVLVLMRRDVTGARLFAFGFAVRAWAAGALSVFVGSGRIAFPDEGDFLIAAGAVLDSMSGNPPGDALAGFTTSSIGYLYAPFVWAGGRSLESLRLASALAGATAVLALWRLGQFVVGQRAARRAAVVMCVMPSIVLWSASGLKEAIVTLLLVVGVGIAVRTVAAAGIRALLVGGVVTWCTVFLLAPLRDSIAFSLGGAVVFGALGVAAMAHVPRRPSKPRRNSQAARPRLQSAAAAMTLCLAVMTALWAAGYGVMGIGALEALRPGALDKAHNLEAEHATGSGSAPVEATSVPEPADPQLIRSMLARLPQGLALTLLRPYPFQTATGSLAEYAGAARLVIIPDQLLWYLLLVLGIGGGMRLARRHFTRALIPLIFLTGTVFFYALAQGNAGTAYRLRSAFVPIVLLFAFVPLMPRRSEASERALMVLPTLGEGGTERHVLQLAEDLDDQGISTRILAFDGGMHQEEAQRRAAAEVVGRRGRFDLSLPLRTARVAAGDGTHRDRIAVWLTYLFAGNFWGGLAARRSGAPLISNIRTSHPRSWPARLLESLVIGEVVVVNSHAVARSAARRGIDPRRIRVIHNGVNAGEIRERAAMGESDARSGLGIGAGEFLIVVPGRIDPLKSQKAAIEAFRHMSVSGKSGARLVLAGAATLEVEQEYLSEVEEAARDLGDRVLMPGMIENLPALISSCDVVLLTSEHEGMPNAVLEAMALGIPVVATRAGGIPEAVVDGETGILCEIGDVGGLGAALSLLESDAEMRVRFGEAGRDRATGEFSVERERDLLIEALDLAASTAEADDKPEAVSPSGVRVGFSGTGRVSAGEVAGA